ncbi:MAG: TetR/AcrR family transcriptional regulator [Terracidiphilus sp.]|nr:TetR/AcrR family transcriptional regulator [Terracidiphilus sp.]
MSNPPKPVKSTTEGQILATAAVLFADSGYNGVSTRDIAAGAGVNEVTIYRHYPRKRDLYLAVLDAELSRVKLKGDQLAQLAEATNVRMAATRALGLIASTLAQSPELFRLLQYSALELGEDVYPLLRRHLGQLVEVVAHYLEPWMADDGMRNQNAKAVLLAQISIVVSHGLLQRLFLRDSSGPESFLGALLDMCDMSAVRNM